jgi:hypothetical protein
VRSVRVATWLIWGAYGALALAIALFAITINVLRPDVGVVFGATLVLGVAGTAAGLVLLGGGVLGMYAVVRQRACRRPGTVITALAGLIGATFLGWTAWGFWTR